MTSEPPELRLEDVAVTGNDVRVGGLAFRAGTDGDRLAVVDPDCTGIARLMLLRPSTGQLFEFSEWARTGRPARARLHSVHPGAVDLESIDTRSSGTRTSDAVAGADSGATGTVEPAVAGARGEPDAACPRLVLRYSDRAPTAAPAAPVAQPEPDRRPPAAEEEES